MAYLVLEYSRFLFDIAKFLYFQIYVISWPHDQVLYNTHWEDCKEAFSVEHGDPERIQTAVDDQLYKKLGDHDTLD